MKFFDHLVISIRSLRANIGRTFLTTLGIIIGVMSVVALLGIGSGVQGSIQSSFDSFGSNTIYAIPGQQDDDFGGPPNLTDSFSLSEVDQFIDFPKKYIEGVTAQTFSLFNVTSDTADKFIQVVAYHGDFETVLDIKAEKGRNISEQDSASRSKVALIGPNVVDDLFDGKNPLGQELSINGTNFTVIGIAESKSGPSFDNPDDYINVPFTTYSQYLVKSDQLSVIAVKAKDEKLIPNAVTEAEDILRRVRRISRNEENDFTVRDAGEILDTINQFTGILTGFLSSIAAISLLVGGIGVMNIMFVSITERTREIGLRKAVGAKNHDILIQFLIEAIMVTVLGGVIGITIGIILSIIVSNALELPSQTYVDSIALGIGFSVVVGAIFGIYPAWKASKLNPIDALRYE